MANRPTGTLLHFLGTLASGPDGGRWTDRQLLQRFAAQGDEGAFAALVRRHGPMVLGVCWRTLRHQQDAEDALQATFLVLARKAGTVAWQDSVAGWLHEVAARVSAEARGTIARRRGRELQMDLPDPSHTPDDACHELSAVLDDELRRLPAKFRAPLLLCCLEGRSRDEAAEQLGWTLGMVKGRLERGRKLLQTRLARRGVSVPAAWGASLVIGELSQAALPDVLVDRTAQLALAFRAGTAAQGAAVALARGVLRGLVLVRLQMLVLLLGLCAAIVGAVLFARPAEPPVLAPSAAAEVKPAAPPLVILRSFTQADARAVAFAPDGRTVAVAGADHAIGLWDVATGRLARQWRAEGPVHAIHFAPDGQHLYTSGPGGKLRQWNLTTLDSKKGWAWPPTHHFHALALGPNGAVATAGEGGDLLFARHALTDINKSRLVVLKNQPAAVRALAWAPDGLTLASGGDDGAVRLYDTHAERERACLPGHGGPVTATAFTSDGRLLASSDAAGGLWFREALTGAVVAHRGQAGDAVRAAVFAPQGLLLSAHASGTVRLWCPRGLAAVGELATHPEPAVAVAVAADGKTVAVVGENGTIRVCALVSVPPPVSVPTAAKDLDGLWRDLAGGDAALAQQAVLRFGANPALAVPFLNQRLRPAPHPDVQEQLERENALALVLGELGNPAAALQTVATMPHHRAALANGLRTFLDDRKLSRATRQAAGAVLAELIRPAPAGETLRALRAVAALELMATPAARALVAELGQGDEDAPLTRAARTALVRWKS